VPGAQMKETSQIEFSHVEDAAISSLQNKRFMPAAACPHCVLGARDLRMLAIFLTDFEF
jgi:hypothetical protein